jgi:hypothetical protein
VAAVVVAAVVVAADVVMPVFIVLRVAFDEDFALTVKV